MQTKLLWTWAWISGISTVIGLAGIPNDLNLWFQAWQWITERVPLLAPQAASFVMSVFTDWSDVGRTWRILTSPAVKLLFDWIPFDIPYLLKELVFIALMVAASRVAWFGLMFGADNILRAVVQRAASRFSLSNGATNLLIRKSFLLSDFYETSLERTQGDRAEIQRVIGPRHKSVIEAIRRNLAFRGAERILDVCLKMEDSAAGSATFSVAFAMVFMVLLEHAPEFARWLGMMD